MRRTVALRVLACASALLVGCITFGGDDNGDGGPNGGGGANAAMAAEALTKSASFAGGMLLSGPIPKTTDNAVSLMPAPGNDVLPGDTALMSFDVDNPDDGNGVALALVQFSGSDQHFEIDPIKNGGASNGGGAGAGGSGGGSAGTSGGGAGTGTGPTDGGIPNGGGAGTSAGGDKDGGAIIDPGTPDASAGGGSAGSSAMTAADGGRPVSGGAGISGSDTPGTGTAGTSAGSAGSGSGSGSAGAPSGEQPGGGPISGRRIDLAYMIERSVCKKLCDATYQIQVFQAVKLVNGKISEHATASLVLDCTRDGDHSLCGSGSSGSKDGTAGGTGTTIGGGSDFQRLDAGMTGPIVNPGGACGASACGACMSHECGAEASQAFGSDWMAGNFSGPCQELGKCYCSCADPASCGCGGIAPNAECAPINDKLRQCLQMFCPGACTGTGGGTGGSGAAGAGAIDAGTANNMCPQGTWQIPLTGASTCDGGMGSYTIHIAPASAGMFSVEQTSMNSLSTPSCDALQTGTGTFDGKTLTVTYPDTTGSCPQHKGQVVLTPDASCNTLMTNGMYTEMGCGSCTAGTCSGCGTMTCTTNYGAGTYMRIGQ